VDACLLQPLSCFLHFSHLEFSKWDFLYQHVACDISFDWQFEAYKSYTVRGSYQLFTPGCRSRRWMASDCNHFGVFFIALALSSQSGIFLYQNVACNVSFDWQLGPHKSDSIRGSYGNFTVGCRSRRWMASCFNNFRAFFISLALSSPSGISLYQTVPCDVSFYWKLEA
jgi:hypothetical protein